MPIRDLAEVGARLEETVRNHPDGDLSDPRRLYQSYEMVAIAILDSEFTNYPPDELRAYLAHFLESKRNDLSLPAYPDTGDQP